MKLLDDPSLRLRTGAPACGGSANVYRDAPAPVRFRPTSIFAAEMGIAPGSDGEVRGRYDRAGRAVLSLWIAGTGYVTGVPADEVEDA